MDVNTEIGSSALNEMKSGTNRSEEQTSGGLSSTGSHSRLPSTDSGIQADVTFDSLKRYQLKVMEEVSHLFISQLLLNSEYPGSPRFYGRHFISMIILRLTSAPSPLNSIYIHSSFILFNVFLGVVLHF